MIYNNLLPILVLSHLVSSISWDAPTQTPRQAFPIEFVAIQTDAPALQKRDSPPTSVCGYFSEPGSSLTCRSSDYCGFNAQNEAFGCCTTAILSGGTYSLYGCWEPSTCYQTIQTFSSNNCADDWVCCEPSCQSDTSAVYCTEATASACIEYQVSVPDGVYYNYACSTTNGVFNIDTSPVGASGTTLNFGSLESSASSTPVVTDSVAVVPPQTTTISSYIEPTETQKTAGGDVAMSVLPSTTTTTKTGSGGRISPTWRLMIICVGLRLGSFLRPSF